MILCSLNQQEPHCPSSTEEFSSTSTALRAPGEPQNPSRAQLCQGLGEDASLSRWETLGVFSTLCWDFLFFPQLQFFTIKWHCKHISLYHMKLGTQRAAQSFCDNCQATSESQLCIFSSPAGATFLHNRELIFCRTFPLCVLSQAKEEGDKNPPLMRNFIYSIFQILLKISPFEQL